MLTLGDQDAIFWFLPAYQQVVSQLRSFEFPLWNPYEFGGMPLFAVWQAGVLDPLNWLYLVFGVSSRTLTIVQQLAFALAAVSTFAYTRSLGLSRRASLFGAVIYAFGGYLVARTLYPGLLHVSALAPLVLFAIERCFQESSGKRGWRMSVAGALILAWQVFAGHPQPLVYSSMLAVAYAAFRFLSIRSGREARLRFVTQCAVIFVGGAGLAAVQLLPAYEVASSSVRQAWSFEMFTLHSLSPISLAGALLPFIHGGGRGIYSLPFWGEYWHHNESQIYLGALAVSLSFAGAVGAWRVRHRAGTFWVGAAIVGLLLAMGKYSGPLAWALYRVPVISSFRSPNRYWMIVALAVAVLAGYAVDSLLKDEGKAPGRVVEVASAVVFLFVSSIAVFIFVWPGRAEEMFRSPVGAQHSVSLDGSHAEYWVPLVSALAGVLLVFAMTRSRRPRGWYLPLMGFLVLDYNLYAAFAPINSAPAAEKRLGSAVPSGLVFSERHKPHRIHLVINPTAGEFSPLFFHGHEMASGYDPLLDVRYKRFSGIDETGRSHLQTLLAENDRTLDLLNVRYIMVAPEVTQASDDLYRNELGRSERWRKVDVNSTIDHYRGYAVFENGNVMPRFWLAGSVKVAGDEQQLRLIRGEEGDFNPSQVALLSPGAVRALGHLSESSPQAAVEGKVVLVERIANRAVIDVETGRDAVLVLSEVFMPGWKATVDGREVGLHRVDYILRGLLVGAGRHRVEVWYAPRSFWIGGAITVIFVFLLGGIITWPFLTQRRL